MRTMIGCLTLEQGGKNIASVILLDWVLAFQGYHAFCFLSHTLTPGSGRQALFSKADTKYGCVAVLPSYLIQSAIPGWPFPNNSLTVNPPQP